MEPQSNIDIAAIAAAAPGIVAVRTDRGGRGTGLVTAPGRVLTAAHNTRGGQLWIRTSEGDDHEVTQVTRSEERDLAVLEVETSALTPAAWAADPGTSIGMPIVAIGAPDGRPRITAGTIAATGTRLRTAAGSPIGGLLEHTAPLPKGSSGGPVLDGSGSVLAINLNRTSGGLYQAVPADAGLQAVIDQLSAGEVPHTPRLGVSLTRSRQAALTRAAVGLPPRAGALVADVEPEGPASAAGLGTGDLIIAVDGTAVRGVDDLLLALRSSGPELVIQAVRGADPERTVTVRMQAD